MKRLFSIMILVLSGALLFFACGGGGGGGDGESGSTLSGTIFLGTDVTDACVGIGVDADADWNNGTGFVARKTFRASSSGSSISYSISGVPSGTYYLFAVVDRDGHSVCDVNEIDIVVGDFVGYYGGTGVKPPVGL